MDVRRGIIEDAVRAKQLKDIDEVGDETEAGTNCGACYEDIEEILKEINRH